MNSMVRFFSILAAVSIFSCLSSCEEPPDPVIKAVEEAENALQGNTWSMKDFTVEVKNPDIPLPFMAGATNSTSDSLQSGLYSINDIFGGIDDATLYRFAFTPDGDILSDSTNSGSFVGTGSYRILGSNDIRLSFDVLEKNRLRFLYTYISSEKVFDLDLDEEIAEKQLKRFNDQIKKRIVRETPDKIGDAIATLLFENEAVQNAINRFLVDLIAGKLDVLNNIP